MFTDGESLLMMQNGEDRAFASREISKANAEIRRLAGLLRQAQADLADALEENEALKRERAARLFEEYQRNRRH